MKRRQREKIKKSQKKIEGINVEDNENNNDKSEEDKTFYLYEEYQRKRKIKNSNILEEIYGIN